MDNDNTPLILDCPVCLQPLTAVNGVNPDLLVTPCGHLFHEECLPAPRNRSHSQKCPACQKNYSFNNCLQYYPVIAETEEEPTPTPPTSNLMGLPSNSSSNTSRSKTGQEIRCGHEGCVESGLRNQRLVDDYNALTSKVEELDKELESEVTEMKQLAVQTIQSATDQLGDILTSLKQDLKRKSSETEQETEPKRRVIQVEETSEDQETGDEDEMEVDSEDDDEDEDDDDEDDAEETEDDDEDE